MGNKSILGGKITNAINIHQEALHLMLQPVMMPILFLMKSHKKLSVVENTSALLGSWSSCTISGFSGSRAWCTCSASQRIHSRGCFNSFNVLSEALVFCILKTERLPGRLRIDGFSRGVHIRQEDRMVAG